MLRTYYNTLGVRLYGPGCYLPTITGIIPTAFAQSHLFALLTCAMR